MLSFRFQSLLHSRSVALGALVIWLGVIFFFSALSGKETTGPPPLWLFIERKGAHVFEYALLMFLSFRYFRFVYARETLVRLLSLAATFSLAYAVTDELHQFFVPLRVARFSDVLIDASGILLSGLILFFLYRNKNRS